MSEQAREMQDKAHKVLLAAVKEAEGATNEHVYMDTVMPLANKAGANISSEEEWMKVAMYLDGLGYFTDGGDKYGMFLVTPRGVNAASRA